MQNLRKYLNPMARVIAFMIFCMSTFIPVAQAGMVSTDRLIQEQQKQWNKVELASLVERDDVKSQLQSMGVDVSDVQARIDALTDDEVLQMSNNLNELPAGSGVVSIAITVLIVLVVTDLLGVTNIFPFIKSLR